MTPDGRFCCRTKLRIVRLLLSPRTLVNDPCCGSGWMLLSAAKVQPNWQFVREDVDLRCVRKTAINLGFRNHYGHVAHGNSLTKRQTIFLIMSNVWATFWTLRVIGHSRRLLDRFARRVSGRRLRDRSRRSRGPSFCQWDRWRESVRSLGILLASAPLK